MFIMETELTHGIVIETLVPSNGIEFIPMGVVHEPASDATFKPMVIGTNITKGESTIAEVTDQKDQFRVEPYSKLMMERDQ